MTQPQPTHLEQLRRALTAGAIDQAAFDAFAGAMTAQNTAGGAIAQGPDAVAAGADGVIAGDNHGAINTGRELTAAPGAQIVYAEQGATVVIGDAPVAMPAVERQSTLGRYLQTLISQNRYLQLQGIRSGGRLVNIELDRIYVTLRANPANAPRSAGWQRRRRWHPANGSAARATRRRTTPRTSRSTRRWRRTGG